MALVSSRDVDRDRRPDGGSSRDRERDRGRSDRDRDRDRCDTVLNAADSLNYRMHCIWPREGSRALPWPLAPSVVPELGLAFPDEYLNHAAMISPTDGQEVQHKVVLDRLFSRACRKFSGCSTVCWEGDVTAHPPKFLLKTMFSDVYC